jgi:hypothetical protein
MSVPMPFSTAARLALTIASSWLRPMPSASTSIGFNADVSLMGVAAGTVTAQVSAHESATKEIRIISLKSFLCSDSPDWPKIRLTI